MLRFLMHLLHARHIPPFLGLLHPITNKDDTPTYVEQWGHSANHFEPGKAKGIERPGIGTKKVNHRFIVTRMFSQAANDGREAPVVGSNHEADDDHNKPLVGSFPGKARTKCR